MRYPIIIHKDINSDYGITVPDLPGCFSAGTNLEEALSNAEEAILTHIEGLLLDDEIIPMPSPLEKYNNKKYLDNAILSIVSVDLSNLEQKYERVNISIPKRILTKFDSYAKKERETRSGFLVTAGLEYIKNSPL
jgi:predicted RNase H-like HicB family nuclease